MTPEELTTTNLQERLSLACSPSTVEQVLILLSQDRRLDVRCALTERKGLSEQLMQKLINDKSKDIRLRMARHPELKAECQEILAGSKQRAIRAAILNRDDLSEELLLKLVAGNRNIALDILERKILSYNLLEQLKLHSSVAVRKALAKRVMLSDDLIAELMEDKNADVVAAISEREDLPAKYIETLSGHKSKKVRAAIAKRCDLSKVLVEKLAEDNNVEVLYAIANRLYLPSYLIKKMLLHTNANNRVCLARKRRLPRKLLKQLIMDRDNEVRLVVASRSDITETMKEALMQDEDGNVRKVIASRADITGPMKDVLALDKDANVRAAIAIRQDITKNMLDTFILDSCKKVRLAILSRDDQSLELAKIFVHELTDNDIGEISIFLLYMERVCNIELSIGSGTLIIGGNWTSCMKIDYGKLKILLPHLLLHPEFIGIQKIVVRVNWEDYGFDEILIALSGAGIPINIERLSLDVEAFDLSWTNQLKLVINKNIYPNLKYLSVECAIKSLQLDLPKIGEIVISSSGNEFHELLFMLMKCNLPNLKKLSISAGNYGSDGQENIMKIYLDDAHIIWPKLRSLTIGARYAYDWKLLLISPIFRQLDKLVIQLGRGCSCDIKMMWSSVNNLIDALIELSDDLSNIRTIVVGKEDYMSDDHDSKIEEKKIFRLKQLYNIKIVQDVYFMGGLE